MRDQMYIIPFAPSGPATSYIKLRALILQCALCRSKKALALLPSLPRVLVACWSAGNYGGAYVPLKMDKGSDPQ